MNHVDDSDIDRTEPVSVSQAVNVNDEVTQPPRRHYESDSTTLGLARGRFAELYGLGSDMEPILMVETFIAEFDAGSAIDICAASPTI